MAILVMVSGALPVLVRVTAGGKFGELMPCTPKLSLIGESVTSGPTGGNGCR